MCVIMRAQCGRKEQQRVSYTEGPFGSVLGLFKKLPFECKITSILRGSSMSNIYGDAYKMASFMLYAD